MRLERRAQVPLLLVVLAPLTAVAASLVLSGGLIALANINPLEAFVALLKGAFGTRLWLRPGRNR